MIETCFNTQIIHVWFLICYLTYFQDARFNKDIDKKTGYRTRNILCMPILDYELEVIGVAQIMNKMDGGTEFSMEDEEVIIYIFSKLFNLSNFTVIFIYCLGASD